MTQIQQFLKQFRSWISTVVGGLQWRLQREARKAGTGPFFGPHLSFTHPDKIDVVTVLLCCSVAVTAELSLLASIAFVPSCHSRQENVICFQAYCIKSRAQVNTLVPCIWTLASPVTTWASICPLNCIKPLLSECVSTRVIMSWVTH